MHLTILGHPFLIGSSSFLQVARTTIQPLIILNLGQVLTGIAELAALELLEKSHRLRLMGAQWFSMGARIGQSVAYLALTSWIPLPCRFESR